MLKTIIRITGFQAENNFKVTSVINFFLYKNNAAPTCKVSV